MRIHWLQHVDFEGLGCIAPWMEKTGHELSCTRFWAGDELPSIGNVDGLVVMGGPMGVYDADEFPWLVAEKEFIKATIERNKPVLGICLGAQLIADVLGSKVWKNDQKEIGFFPIIGNPEDPVSRHWKNQTVFHWHGDTFSISNGAIHLASSEATQNQAFRFGDKVLGLQFHLETTEESLQTLYENAQDEICDAPFIQTLEQMHPFFPMLGNSNELMAKLLAGLFK